MGGGSLRKPQRSIGESCQQPASQEYSSLESIQTRERIHPNGKFFKRHKDGA